LGRTRGETVAEWMRRWREAGLLEPWPAVLPLDGHPVPLAIGSLEPLLARLNVGLCPPERFGWLLGWYASTTSYLIALAQRGAIRHDVDGRQVEPVSAEHRQGARARLKERHARRRSSRRRAGARHERGLPRS
jgi:sRNA-binding protein